MSSLCSQRRNIKIIFIAGRERRLKIGGVKCVTIVPIQIKVRTWAIQSKSREHDFSKNYLG